MADGKGELKRESTSLLGGGGSWHGFGGGDVNFGSKDFQSTIIGEAVKAAVDSMTADIVARRASCRRAASASRGGIAAVEGRQIVLNIGTSCGTSRWG